MRQISRRSFADVLTSARDRARRSGEGEGEGGFSLIELMIALFVFALLASGFAVTMSATLKAFQRSRVKTLGEQIANDQLENARRMPYDDLGNIAGNPLGLIPLTVAQSVGGYQFDVTTRVSFVDDPVAISIPTGADYKRVIVTVDPTGLDAPSLVMSTLVAPPAKPPADKGRVSVTVNDYVIDQFVPNVGVDLIKGVSVTPQRETSNAVGVTSFPSLTPSTILGPSPAPGATDWYYVKRGTAPSPMFPAGYYLLPDSDSAAAGSPNKFTLAAATNVSRVLSIYKAAMVNLQLTDSSGALWSDAATVTVTPTALAGTTTALAPRVFNIAAGTSLAPFNEVPATVGIVPKNAYSYTFVIDGPDGCQKVLTPANLYDSTTYATTAAINLPATMPCQYATVNLHVTDLYDGSNMANATITVDQGPLAPTFSRNVITDALGNASLRVRVGAGNYRATVSAAGRASVFVTFPVLTGATVTAPNINVPPPTKTITLTLTDGFTKAALAGATAVVTGGPLGTVTPNCTTNASGTCVWTVPTGPASPNYTITIAPDIAGHAGISGSVPSTVGNSAIALENPWLLMMTLNVHVVDKVTGGLLPTNTVVELTGGPPGSATPYTNVNTPYKTDASGDVTMSVPSGTGSPYTLTVQPAGGRLQGTVTVPPAAAVPVTLQVPWPMANFTIQVVRTISNTPQGGRTVRISGGPAGVTSTMLVSTPLTTDATGRVSFQAPVGTAVYTVSVVSGAIIFPVVPQIAVPAGGVANYMVRIS